ncbi:hypothetical protein KJ980_00060 [Patescibacteria group bacterium]|nr:hypothetical protein [Patescibacteria group bacterium]MBU4098022.1 hypothetical protein [Patescibacteria group bacterium]
MFEKMLHAFWWRIIRKRGRRVVGFSIEKRQKFIIGVLLLTIGLFYTEFQFSRSGVFISLFLAVLTDLFLFWALFQDIKDKFVYEIFILPFFYSLSFGLFCFLTPNTTYRIVLALVYAFGLYSLYLSQNIFVVSSTRTIALLSGARIVSFVVTLVSFFLLTNVVFTLHIVIFPILLLVLIYTYFLLYHSLWTYTLQKIIQPLVLWVTALTLCIIELTTILWFWPTKPPIISLFLTGFFYIVVGLSHVWFEKRLFKGVLWEYVWVGFVVIFILIAFSFY